MNTANETSTPSASNGAPTKNGNPNPLLLKCEYRNQEFEHWPRPSELELAMLAAQLARSGKVAPKRSVALAWEVFRESCRRLQADHREVTAYQAQMDPVKEEPDRAEGALPKGVPVPKKYPVTYRQIEGLLLPKQKGRSAERASLIREYLLAQLVGGCFVVRPKFAAVNYWELDPNLLEELRQKLKDDVARRFEKYRNTVFDAEAYARFAVPFLSWHRRHIRAKKAAAARKRWESGEAKRKSANAQTEPGESKDPKKSAQNSL